MDETQSCVYLASAAHQETVNALVDAVMEGVAFLALTGPRGVGKTIAAAAIRDELTRRSIRVMEVRRQDNTSISLLGIAAQILGRSDARLNHDDIETLFDALTVREDADEKLAVIVDDAESMQADALGYLRLLAILAPEAMPRIVFVGNPEFWITEYAVSSGLKELIGARWELDRLTADEALNFAERSVVARGGYAGAFAPGALEALTRHGDGLSGRISALVAIAGRLQVDKPDHWLTANLIDQAAAKLDAGEVDVLEDPGQPNHNDDVAENEVASAPSDVADEPVIVTSRWSRRARAASVAGVIVTVSAALTWQALVHLHRTEALASDAEARVVAVADQKAADDTGGPVRAEAGMDAVSSGFLPSAPSAIATPAPTTAEATSGPAVPPAQIATENERPEAPPAVTEAQSPTPEVRLEPSVQSAAVADASPSEKAAEPPSVQPPPVADAMPPEKATEQPVSSEPVADAAPAEGTAEAPVQQPAPIVAVSTVEKAPEPAVQNEPPPSPPPAASSPVPAVTPAVAISSAPAAQPPEPDKTARSDVTVLLSRGDEMLTLGDIAAARLLYERAATLGSGRAATALGQTYDPAFLASIHASGVTANRAVAAAWYRKGAALGDADSATRLARLTGTQ